jgi:hypothetical protein
MAHHQKNQAEATKSKISAPSASHTIGFIRSALSTPFELW